jgi:phosphoribosylglycinamide formyltransferase-1
MGQRRFVGELILPGALSADRDAMSRGEPGLPRRFTWRKGEYQVKATLKSWKGATPDRTHGSGELYVHKHWYTIAMDSGDVWTVYFDRQTRGTRNRKARWFLYAIEQAS